MRGFHVTIDPVETPVLILDDESSADAIISLRLDQLGSTHASTSHDQCTQSL